MTIIGEGEDHISSLGGLPTATPTPGPSTPTPVPHQSGLPPLPAGTFYDFPDEIADLLAQLPVPDGLRLYVQREGCPSQFYPPTLSMQWGNECENTGGAQGTWAANYVDFTREVLFRVPPGEFASTFGTEHMIRIFAHKICHAHQHQMIIDAGLSDPGLQKPIMQLLFDLTPEGEAFFAATGWERDSNIQDGPDQYSGGTNDEAEGWRVYEGAPWYGVSFPYIEDHATVCAWWYTDRDNLRTSAPHRYEFAKEWLGRWVK